MLAGRPRLGPHDEPVALLVHVGAERVDQPAADRARGQHDRQQRRVPQQVRQAPARAEQAEHRQQLQRLRTAERVQLRVRVEQLAAQLNVVLGRRGEAAGAGWSRSLATCAHGKWWSPTLCQAKAPAHNR
eukprot:scaffold28470_cov43-Phaeocystis_antarctica.AAC.2